MTNEEIKRLALQAGFTLRNDAEAGGPPDLKPYVYKFARMVEGHGYEFKAGDKVMKVGGSYQATGTIVAAFKTTAGHTRYVFEFNNPAGMLHIFNGNQLAGIPSPCPECNPNSEFFMTVDCARCGGQAWD